MTDKIAFLSGSTVIMTGSSINVAIPSGTKAIFIRAETGPVYFEVNSTTGSATTNSSGYVPTDSKDYIPEIYNLQSFYVIGGSGVKAHLQYFSY